MAKTGKAKTDVFMLKEKQRGSANKNTGWAMAIAAAILLVAAAALFYRPASNEPTMAPANTTQTQELSESAKVFFASLEKVSNFPKTYQIVSSGKVEGAAVRVTINAYNDGMGAKIETPFDSRTAYWKGNQTVMCEMAIGSREVCAGVDSKSEALVLMFGVENEFINKETAKKDLDRDRKLVALGALKLVGPPKIEEVAGRKCNRIAYQLDYGTLTVDQMNELQVPPRLKNISATECLDDEYGNPLEINVSYELDGAKLAFGKQVLKFVAPFDANVTMPAALAGEQALMEALTKTEIKWLVSSSCGAMNGSEAEACYKRSAIDYAAPEYCENLGAGQLRDQCVNTIATRSLDLELCKKSGSLVDDCYGSIAVMTGRLGLCEMIANSTIKELCANMTKK